jgi:glycine cleavage system protein P-like pyridoxal-binding family
MIEPTESENLEELDRLWRYDFYQKKIETWQ